MMPNAREHENLFLWERLPAAKVHGKMPLPQCDLSQLS